LIEFDHTESSWGAAKVSAVYSSIFSGAISHTRHSTDPYVALGFKKWNVGLLDLVLVEALGENLTERTALLWIM
jgi:hypothetical protein